MKTSFWVTVVALLTCSMAQAEFSKGSQTLAVFGGYGGSATPYDFQPGSEENVTGGGGAFGGQYLYYFSQQPAMAVGFDLTSALNGPSKSDELLQGFDSEGRIKSVVGMAVL